jgi:hypothetical protein
MRDLLLSKRRSGAPLFPQVSVIHLVIALQLALSTPEPDSLRSTVQTEGARFLALAGCGGIDSQVKACSLETDLHWMILLWFAGSSSHLRFSAA